MEPTAVEKTSSSKVILSVIVILVIAAIAFAMTRGNKGQDDQMGTTTNATTSDTAANPNAFSGTIFDLVARGGDWKCTWANEQNGVKLEGTTFVSRGKFKSDVEMSGVGLNATAHAIGDGQVVYSWSSLAPTTGIKFPAQPQGTAALEVSGSNAQSLQFTSEYSYDCAPWTADSGTFALPSGITFKDVTTVN